VISSGSATPSGRRRPATLCWSVEPSLVQGWVSRRCYTTGCRGGEEITVHPSYLPLLQPTPTINLNDASITHSTPSPLCTDDFIISLAWGKKIKERDVTRRDSKIPYTIKGYEITFDLTGKR
jgi:hypothetical protein